MLAPKTLGSVMILTALSLLSALPPALAHVDDQRLVYADNAMFDFIGRGNNLNENLIAELRTDAEFGFADILQAPGPTVVCRLYATQPVLPPRECYQQSIDEFVAKSIEYVKRVTTLSGLDTRNFYLDQANNRDVYVKIALIDSGVDLNRFLSTGSSTTNLWADMSSQFLVWSAGDYLRNADRSPKLLTTDQGTRFTIGIGMDYVGFDNGILGRSLRTRTGDWDASAFAAEIRQIPAYVGIGSDGRDRWPFPYIIRTDSFNPSLVGRRDALVEYSKNNRKRLMALRRAVANDVTMTSGSIDSRYRLLDIFHPARNLEKEMSNQADHGTHLAGLLRNLSFSRAMTPQELSQRAPGDTNSRITFEAKVIPFRVYQPNRPATVDRRGTRLTAENENLTLLNNIRRAVAESAARGVKIVNLSFTFGFPFEQHKSGELTAAQLARLELWERTFRSIVDEHPEIVFVTAAGNEGELIDGIPLVRPPPNDYAKLFRRIPCDLPQGNVLCVGALAEYRDDFWRAGSLGSNHLDPSRKAEFVLATGENIRSVSLSKYCDSPELEAYLNGEPTTLPPNQFDPRFRTLNSAWQQAHGYSAIRNSCLDRSDRNELTTLSGTSQAAALVTRAVANMLIRESAQNLVALNGAEIVRRFLNPANKHVRTVNIGGVIHKKINYYPEFY